MVASYFDDNITMDIAGSNSSAQRAVREVYKGFGAPLSEAKHVPMGARRIFLGQYVSLDTALEDGMVHMECTDQFRNNTVAFINKAQEAKKLFPADAGKLRGQLGRSESRESVSYTHLTLPTKRIV